MSSVLLTDARIVTPDGVIESGWLQVRGDRIAGIGEGHPPEDEDPPADGGRPAELRALGGAWVVPGFVDLHVHGGGGGSFADGAAGARTAIAAHRRAGTTSMLASLATASVADTVARCRELVPLCEAGELLGIHLEGPFLSPGHRGAHRESELLAPNLAVLDDFLAAGGGWVRSVTLAPELEGAERLIGRLDELGLLVAFGHTSATDEEMTGALRGRRGYITHLFNGMPPIHHRDPGAVTAALLDPDCVVELIVDGIHVDPDIVRLVFRLAHDRTALVTDAMAAAALGDGDYELGGGRVEVRDGRAWSPSEHSLAGSTLTMAAAFRTAVAFGIPPAEASAAASSTPARLLGAEHEFGSLRVGRRADIVVLGDAPDPQLVLRAGVPVEDAPC